jgi:probable HAF family extracellular repeat protein
MAVQTTWDNCRITDLGTLPGDEFSGANGINDRGQIVGTSSTSTGFGHAVLWQHNGTGAQGGGDSSSKQPPDSVT